MWEIGRLQYNRIRLTDNALKKAVFILYCPFRRIWTGFTQNLHQNRSPRSFEDKRESLRNILKISRNWYKELTIGKYWVHHFRRKSSRCLCSVANVVLTTQLICAPVINHFSHQELRPRIANQLGWSYLNCFRCEPIDVMESPHIEYAKFTLQCSNHKFVHLVPVEISTCKEIAIVKLWRLIMTSISLLSNSIETIPFPRFVSQRRLRNKNIQVTLW